MMRDCLRAASRRRFWLPALILGFACSSTWPDTVLLKDGKTVEGEVVSEEEAAVVVKTVSGHQIINMADVKEIRKTKAGEQPKPGAGTRKADTDKPANPGATREGRAAMVGASKLSDISEKTVDCPKCSGTGFRYKLECLNCNKSGKPGYKHVGHSYELCGRCGGTGFAAVYHCALCSGTGKVYPSHITPADGGTKRPPPNFNWCGKCSGTGIEIWDACNQCKRSKYPGYMFFGDHLELCNRCNGATRLPALKCTVCRGTGFVQIHGDAQMQFTRPSTPDGR